MAKNEVKKISRITVTKKIWYKILAPQIFGQVEIGESYLSAPEPAVGRTVQYNLKELTGNVKDQNAYVNFKIEKVVGTTLHTSVRGYELTPSYVKRLIRQDCNRLDDCFVIKSKDGTEMIVKVIMITFHKTTRSVRSELQRQLRIVLQEEAGKDSFTNFLKNIVYSPLRGELKRRLHKIYPLKEAAIRSLALRRTAEGLPAAPEPSLTEEVPAAETVAEAVPVPVEG